MTSLAKALHDSRWGEHDGPCTLLDALERLEAEARASEPEVWAVVFSNYSPAEVDSLWAFENDARERAGHLGSSWDVQRWTVQRTEARASQPLTLDVDVQTVVRHSSPYRNCQYAAAFRAPCPEVNALVPDSWCGFCQAHARLTAALT